MRIPLPRRLLALLAFSIPLATPTFAQDNTPTSDAEGEVIVLEDFEVYSDVFVSGLQDRQQSDIVGNFLGGDALDSLPDDTVAEALNRITGVNVVDGGNVTIRGVQGKLNSVTLDGQSIAIATGDTSTSPRGGDDRAFDVSTIPVEAIQGIEVIKSLTPDYDADAVGGRVNLITADAFDYDERVIKPRIEARYNEQGEEWGWGTAVTYGESFFNNRFGMTFNFSYRDETIHEWDVELRQTSNPIVSDQQAVDNGLAEEVGLIADPLLERFDPRETITNRTTATLSGSIDARIGDHTVVYFKPYLNYREREIDRKRTIFRPEQVQPDPLPTPPVTIYTLEWDNFIANAARLQLNRYYTPERIEDQIQFSVGGDTTFDDWGLLEYAYTRGIATQTFDQTRVVFEILDSNERRLARHFVDNSDKLLPFTESFLNSTGEDYFASQTYRDTVVISKVRFQEFEFENVQQSANIDYTHTFDWPILRNLKFGGKWRMQERESRASLEDWRPDIDGDAQTYLPVPISLFPEGEPLQSFDGHYAFLGPTPEIEPVVNYFNDNRDIFRRDENSNFTGVAVKNYDSDEEILSAYAMGRIEWAGLTAVGGTRVERTENTYTWLASVVDPPLDTLDRIPDESGSDNYTNWFPAVVLTYRLGTNHVFRAAWTNGIARPDYDDLVPYDQSVYVDAWGDSIPPGVDSGFLDDLDSLERGNPNLQPQLSESYDLGYEFYYNNGESNFSVNVFRKYIEDFIFVFLFEDEALTGDGSLVRRVTDFPLNGPQQIVEGIELSWTQTLSFLPAPLDGFGFSASYTITQGEQSEPILPEDPLTGDTVPVRDPEQLDFRTRDRLINQPETLYNVQLWWEKWGFAVRLAYFYYDEILREISDQNNLNTIEEETSQWDLSFQYRINQTWRIVLDVKNVTDEPETIVFNTYPNFPQEFETGGREWVFGIRGSF